MAYVPKDWVTGEVITEQALDHIEQGIANIGGGVAMINVTTDGQLKRLGKSYNEIVALIENGTLPIAVETSISGEISIMPCYLTIPGEVDPYQVSFLDYGATQQDKTFSADTATAELTRSNSIG